MVTRKNKKRFRKVLEWICRKRGFTLLELLVVIAIIAMLSSILLPALSKAREKGRGSVCISNLKQISLAFIMYADDNDGWYPPACADASGADLHRWHGERPDTSSPFVISEQTPIYPYLKNKEIRACPSFKEYSSGYEAGCGGYGYNDQYVGGSSMGEFQLPAKDKEIKNPSETIMVTDAAILSGYTTGNIVEYSFVPAPKWDYMFCGWGLFDSTPGIHFRHNEKANVAWCDGHVTSEPMGFTRADAQKAANIGYVGSSDNNDLYDRN